MGKDKEKNRPKDERNGTILSGKNSSGTPFHAGIQITNKEGTNKSTFVVHRIKNGFLSISKLAIASNGMKS